MKEKIVRKRNYIPTFETEALAEYFSDMSEKGLFIKSMGSEWISFIKGEPTRVRYCVDLFKPNKNQNIYEYIEICKSSGWHFVCNDPKSHCCIFYADRPDPVPLQTDPSIEAEYIRKTSVKSLIWLAFWSLVLLFLWFNAATVSFFQDPEEFYKFNMDTVLLFSIIFAYLPMAVYNIVQYIRCRKRIKLLSSNGETKKTSYKKLLRTKSILTWSGIFVAAIVVIISILSFNSDWKLDYIPSYAQGITLQKLHVDSEPTFNFYTIKPSIYIKRYYELGQNWDEESPYQLTVEYYACNFRFVAKDIYNRSYDTYDRPLTSEECAALSISEGKYSYYSENKTIDMILRKDNDIYKVSLTGFSSLDENIKSVIRNAVAEQQ